MPKFFIPSENHTGDLEGGWREIEAADEQGALAQIDPRLLHEGDRVELIELDVGGSPTHVYHIVSVGPDCRWSLQRWKSRDM